MTDPDAELLPVEEFTRRLADALNEDPEEITRKADAFEIEPPWEAEWEYADE